MICTPLKTAGFFSIVTSQPMNTTYILNKPICGSICNEKKVSMLWSATDFLWSQELDCTVWLLLRNGSWKSGKAFKCDIRPHKPLQGMDAHSNCAVENKKKKKKNTLM